MTKAKGNPDLRGLSALLGDTIVIRKVGGQFQFVNRRPRRKRKPTPKQAVRREKFREAAQYAKRQIAQAEFNALYAKGITKSKHTSYLVALSDYLNAPTVKEIDTQHYQGAIDDMIMIKASDDFMVTKVKVRITNSVGKLIEEGEAIVDPNKIAGWTYRTTASNPLRTGTTIKVVAYDRPQNSGIAEVVC